MHKGSYFPIFLSTLIFSLSLSLSFLIKLPWSTGEGNGKPLQYSCLENPMNSMKRQKDMTLEDEPCRMEGVHYVTGEDLRNSSRKNEVAGPK